MRSSQGLCKDRDSRNPLEEMVKSLRCFQGMYLGMEQGQAAHGPSSLLGPGRGAPLGPMLRKHVDWCSLSPLQTNYTSPL